MEKSLGAALHKQCSQAAAPCQLGLVATLVASFATVVRHVKEARNEVKLAFVKHVRSGRWRCEGHNLKAVRSLEQTRPVLSILECHCATKEYVTNEKRKIIR
jgi:hypothetical protein